MLKGNESVKDLAHASSLCGACKDVCPVRIDIPRMLIELREHLDREKIAPWTERRRLPGAPAPAHVADRLPALGRGSGAWLQRPFVRDGTAPAACRSSSASGRARATCRRSPPGPSASAGRSWR